MMSLSNAVHAYDPNAHRVIEELASVMNDAELRLHIVRLGLAQAFPQLAPSLAGVRGASWPGAIQSPFNVGASAFNAGLGTINPFAGVPQIPGINPAIGANLLQAIATSNPFVTPFGSPIGAFGLSTTPFGMGASPLASIAALNPHVAASILAAQVGIPGAIPWISPFGAPAMGLSPLSSLVVPNVGVHPYAFPNVGVPPLATLGIPGASPVSGIPGVTTPGVPQASLSPFRTG